MATKGPKIPQQYDAPAYERIINDLQKKIDGLEAKLSLSEAKSTDNAAKSHLEEGKMYFKKAADQENVVLVVKLNGRVYTKALDIG